MNGAFIKGPRPLSLHISNSQITWATLQKLDSGALQSFKWHSSLRAEAARIWDAVEKAGIDPEAFTHRLHEKAKDRQSEFLDGINSYLKTTYKPNEVKGDVVWQEGGVSLHDYGGEGEPILLILSLINPGYIIDLMEGRSFITYLKSQGYRPFVLNWGAPGEVECQFTLEDYVTKRLVPVLEWMNDFASGAVPVIGYCMGGTLTVALASMMSDKILKLVLLAAPWDFHSDVPMPGRYHAAKNVERIAAMPEGAAIAVDMMQSFFTSVDPTLSDRKFRDFGSGKYMGESADFFAAMEIWANNGPPLAAGVMRDCMSLWYVENATMKGKWMVGGAPVKPQNITCPVLVASPKTDRLVPQDCAFAILAQIPQCDKLEPPSGHIGMMVGDRAPDGLWKPVCDWLKR